MQRQSYQKEVPVNLENDLHVPRQEVLQERDRPALQRLRKHRVVGVGTRRHRDLKRLTTQTTIVTLSHPRTIHKAQ